MTLEKENNLEQYALLQNKLKKIVKNIHFLELRSDMTLKNGIKITKDVPIPIYDKDLVNDISMGRYDESVPFRNIMEGMMFMLGCDDDFRFNKYYTDILKNSENIDAYILRMAYEFRKNNDFIASLACIKALVKISDKHDESLLNYAHILREIALNAKKRGSEDEYELYYDLSYNVYSKLIDNYPDSPYSYYHMGFYEFNEGKYSEALKNWERAYSLMDESELKEEIERNMESAKQNLAFENGKRYVMDGDIPRGLKILLPLMEKHNDWSEVKYYVALAFRKCGNYIKAEMLLNELLVMGEDFSEIFNELGLCYFNLGQVERSVECFEEAVDKQCDIGYLCNLGIAYHETGNIQKARECIDKAYKMNPNDELTKKCCDWIGNVHIK